MQSQRAVRAGLPPSAKLVLRVLEELGEACFEELLDETQLPRRTLYSALKELRRVGLVEVKPCLRDARRKFYCYSLR